MSSERRLLSLLIVIHLVAISAWSVPDPRALNAAAAGRPTAVGVLAGSIEPVLDALVAKLTPLEAKTFEDLAPIRALTRPYIQAGLRQKWDMFANPLTTDQYVRVAHYVESSRAPGRIRVFRELVMPAQHEDTVRLTHRFRDKAIINSLETYAADRRDHPEADSSADLQSLASHFDRRFRATYLSQDETVRRTEVWFGGALIPPIGQRVPDDELRERWAALQRYWEGPVEEPSIGPPPEPGVLQSESGIVWRLEYVGTP